MTDDNKLKRIPANHGYEFSTWELVEKQGGALLTHLDVERAKLKAKAELKDRGFKVKDRHLVLNSAHLIINNASNSGHVIESRNRLQFTWGVDYRA